MKNLSVSLYETKYQQLFNELKKLRIEKHWTQRELANRLYVHYSLVAKVETGNRKLDIFETVNCLKPFDIDFCDFITQIGLSDKKCL